MIPVKIEQIWTELASGRGAPAHKRIDDSHPLDFYAGLEADGTRELLLICDSEPPSGKKFRAFDVPIQRRQDGRWALLVRLLRPEFVRVFAHLCEDLIEATRRGCSRAEAPVLLLERLVRWQRLFDRDRSGLLDDARLRGLVGELLFLGHFAIPAVGPEAGVEAWLGPLDGIQDFRFSDRLVEVKTSAFGQLRVRISSVEQLDVIGSDLYLSVAPIEGVSQGSSGALLVAEIVQEVRSKLVGPRWPLQIPPSVATSNSPSGDDRSAWIVALNPLAVQGELAAAQGYPRRRPLPPLRHGRAPRWITRVYREAVGFGGLGCSVVCRWLREVLGACQTAGSLFEPVASALEFQ